MQNDTIQKIAKIIHPIFQQNPYDFLSMEIEAQTKVVNTLREQIGGTALFWLGDSLPKLEGTKSSRFKLEGSMPEDGWKHDIIAIKKDMKFGDNNNLVREVTRNDIDFFIEIKVGWGFSRTHFSHAGILKDIELITKFKNGYLFYFLGNNLSECMDYQAQHEKIKKERDIETGRFIVFFLDEILY